MMFHVTVNTLIFSSKWLNLTKNRLLPFTSVRCCSKSSKEALKDVTEPEFAIFEDEEDIFNKETIIEKKRNKSRLYDCHRNIIMNKIPYSEPMASYHLSVKYNRKIFGKYGQLSGVNPGIAWPTKEDLIELKEYESVAYPFTIQEMVQKAKDTIAKENKQIEENQIKIAQQLLKLDKWKAEINERAAKKFALATAAKEKKERLIEEVRRHFGYKVDPKEDRFKEMLEQKEKAERKKAKEARSKAREEMFLAKVKEIDQEESK